MPYSPDSTKFLTDLENEVYHARHHYGLCEPDDSLLSFRKIGEMVGLSGSRVQQIYSTARRKVDWLACHGDAIRRALGEEGR
jgi:DNA-directed RNA polymerase sigma subunit (sigma70/sigma32)